MLAQLTLALTSIWYGLRCVVGLVKASQNEAYPNPLNYIL